MHAEKNCSPWSGIHIQYSDPDLTSGCLIEDLGLDPQLFGAKVRGLEGLPLPRSSICYRLPGLSFSTSYAPYGALFARPWLECHAAGKQVVGAEVRGESTQLLSIALNNARTCGSHCHVIESCGRKAGSAKTGLDEPRGAGTRSKYISSRRSVVLAIIALLVEATCCSSAAKATG